MGNVVRGRRSRYFDSHRLGFEGDETATSRVDEELVRFQNPISSNESNTLCKLSSS